MPRKLMPTSQSLNEATDALKDEPAKHIWIWFVYVGLFATSIPWYFPTGQYPSVWFGLPSWVVLSLASTLGVALFTVFIIRHYWVEGKRE